MTRDEQLRRFNARENEPLEEVEAVAHRQASLDKWDDYTEAKEAMFFHTDTADAPWTIVKSDDKKRARLNCMKHFLASLDYPEKDKQRRRASRSADRRLQRARHRQQRAHLRQEPASRRQTGQVMAGKAMAA